MENVPFAFQEDRVMQRSFIKHIIINSDSGQEWGWQDSNEKSVRETQELAQLIGFKVFCPADSLTDVREQEAAGCSAVCPCCSPCSSQGTWGHQPHTIPAQNLQEPVWQALSAQRCEFELSMGWVWAYLFVIYSRNITNAQNTDLA